VKLPLCAGLLLLATACGGSNAPVTEADVELRSPTRVHDVFDLSQRHHLELTQVVSTDVGSDHHTEGVMVTSGMDEQDVGGGGEFEVNHFFVTGREDRLRDLRGEPAVRSVLIKREVLERIRRERENR
jgi:hypothetical protein